MLEYLSTVCRVGRRKDTRLNKLLERLLKHELLELVGRWILGVTFIYASYHKIISPADFAKIIYGYDLFPSYTINLIAIILPHIELLSGVALIVGIYSRSAIIIVNGMLFFFIIVLAVNLIRGHEFDCGCFSVDGIGHETSAATMLIRDIIYFLLGLYIYFYEGKRTLSIHS